ncbi:MAG: AgmX/PglI C-terminal domain-containing protein [Polyangiaceae bacterium]|nr:AgmX/PglI C-terminal domain-containing protein [Polyangiaceae bacterium]
MPAMRRAWGSLFVVGCAWSLAPGCSRDVASKAGGAASAQPSASASAAVVDEVPARPRPPARRGLGTLSARVPGTDQIVGGVTLTSHKVKATVRAGFARTEVEEVWRNDDPRALEGTFRFALPASAAITRLALEVDGKLVEGELVEQRRAASIFRGIVDDTVRPRDPALLDQRGGKVELKIFPLPPRGGTRRVVLAYDELLPERDGQGAYVLPLTSGRERETTIGDVRAEVTIERAASATSDDPVSMLSEGRYQVVREAREVAPKSDLVVRYTRAQGPVTRRTPRAGEAGAAKGETAAGFVTARLAVPTASGPAPAGPRVFVVDVGHGQPAESLVDAWEVIDAALARAPEGARFAVLACDASCAGFPEAGLVSNTRATRADFVRWSTALSPRGASDLAGMLIEAARRAGADGAVAWFTRGGATTGELTPDAIVARVKAATTPARALHLLGTGPFVDEPTLRALSEGLGATLTRLSGDAPRRDAERLDRAVLRAPKLTVPAGFTLVSPSPLPALAAGDELVVTARATPDVAGDVALEGELDGAPVRVTVAVAPGPGDGPALVESLWARQRISSLTAKGDPALDKELVKLSHDFHVLSPKTSFLVLENEAMFAAFGVPRTSRRADDLSDAVAPGAAQASPGSAKSSAAAAGGGDTAGGQEGLMSTGRGAGTDLGGSGGLGPGGIGGSISGLVVAPRAQVTVGGVSSAPPSALPGPVATRVVRQQTARFRRCAELGLRVDPSATGRVTVSAVVTASGSVASASASGVSQQTAACVAAAARGMNFPQTEGGQATLRFIVNVSISKAVPSKPTGGLFAAPQPSFTVAPASDAWLSGGDEELQKLGEARDRGAEKRRSHEALVLGLLRRGRDATPAAREWVTADPDDARAHGLLAEALALTGGAAEAAGELGVVAALDPGNAAAQLAAARAFLAAGDPRRACAHTRAAAGAEGAATTVRAEALRCRADELGEASARDEARALAEKQREFKAVADGERAPIELGSPGALRFESTCAGCPPIAVVTPTGRVIAAATPSKAIASARRVDAALSMSGIYRAVFIGAAPATDSELVVTTPTGPRTLKVPAGARTLGAVTVELPCFGCGYGSAR